MSEFYHRKQGLFWGLLFALKFNFFNPQPNPFYP